MATTTAKIELRIIDRKRAPCESTIALKFTIDNQTVSIAFDGRPTTATDYSTTVSNYTTLSDCPIIDKNSKQLSRLDDLQTIEALYSALGDLLGK